MNQQMLPPRVRNVVQDFLWADEPVIVIPKRHRRELARALQPLVLFRHWDNFVQLIRAVFAIPDDPLSLFLGTDTGIIASIHKHFIQNPEDANVEWLFEQLECFDLSPRRFGMFIEGLVSADVQLDPGVQHAIAKTINESLRDCGAELRQTGEADGYPVFSLVMLRAARGRAKNLIFASSIKPDIRFRDAIDNEIEILSNPDQVLVYDWPLGRDGLRWHDLQSWWAECTAQTDPEKAKSSLYRRLLHSLPKNSPPQYKLFTAFFSSYRDSVPGLPALLPEVWLHWDPKTVAARGPQALLTHRMDFLMLLPGGARVVIEVDGQQHYAGPDGRADPREYARLAAGDRGLRLAGYEVYRFGAIELLDDGATNLVKNFFDTLFQIHGVTASRINDGRSDQS